MGVEHLQISPSHSSQASKSQCEFSPPLTPLLISSRGIFCSKIKPADDTGAGTVRG